MARRSRLPRIEKSEDFHVDDETASLWAVSYADFLMVLLSFFILFFSTDNDVKDDIIERITKDTGKMGQGATSAGGTSVDGERGLASIDVDALSEVLAARNVSVEKLHRKIIFKFSDSLYGVGDYQLNEKARQELQTVLELLKPYYGAIEMVIVGHTDSLNVRSVEGRMIKNNFDLSVFRATRALEDAVRFGAPIETLSAKGSADFKRNSRTLSLEVTSR